MSPHASLRHYRRDSIISLIIGCALLGGGIFFHVFPVGAIVFFALALVLFVLGERDAHLPKVDSEEVAR